MCWECARLWKYICARIHYFTGNRNFFLIWFCSFLLFAPFSFFLLLLIPMQFLPLFSHIWASLCFKWQTEPLHFGNISLCVLMNICGHRASVLDLILTSKHSIQLFISLSLSQTFQWNGFKWLPHKVIKWWWLIRILHAHHFRKYDRKRERGILLLCLREICSSY